MWHALTGSSIYSRGFDAPVTARVALAVDRFVVYTGPYKWFDSHRAGRDVEEVHAVSGTHSDYVKEVTDLRAHFSTSWTDRTVIVSDAEA
jgi:hypothetical protein